jgi:Predicted Fe-S oxidoreductases
MHGKLGDSLRNWRWAQATGIMAKVHDLSYFFWESTLKCNLECRHCGSDCTKHEKMPELEASKVLEVFSDIAQNYNSKKVMVAVTGGEPLIRKDLFEILSQVSSLGFPWGMVTNGMLVNEKTVADCTETGMQTVSVSLDGLENSHNWLRNNEMCYKNAVNALRLFVNKGSFKIVEAITCVNSRNISELDELYVLLKNIGVNRWRLISVFPNGRAENNPELQLNRDLLIKLFGFVREKRHDNSLYVSYSEEGYLGCEWENKVRDGLFFCGAGINVASLLCDGSFGACPSLSREWIQGHVDEILFSEAWETRYKNMRERDWLKSPDCSCCKEWKKCRGSSLHLWDWESSRQKVCHYKLLNI